MPTDDEPSALTPSEVVLLGAERYATFERSFRRAGKWIFFAVVFLPTTILAGIGAMGDPSPMLIFFVVACGFSVLGCVYRAYRELVPSRQLKP
ncbi:MAG: hypothetical protein U0132_22110 [Gemmatimonadaceae bacterium]